MNLVEIGKNISNRRKLLRINQLDLCSIAEISQHTLSDIENGSGNPTISTLMKVMDILGLEFDIKVKDKTR